MNPVLEFFAIDGEEKRNARPAITITKAVNATGLIQAAPTTRGSVISKIPAAKKISKARSIRMVERICIIPNPDALPTKSARPSSPARSGNKLFRKYPSLIPKKQVLRSTRLPSIVRQPMLRANNVRRERQSGKPRTTD